MNYRIIRHLGIASLVVSGWLVPFAQADNIRMEEVPTLIRSTIEKEAKGQKVTEIERDTEDNGKVVYEAEWEEQGKKVEIKIDEQGKVIERKVE